MQQDRRGMDEKTDEAEVVGRVKWMKDRLTKSGEGGRQGDTALKSWREMQQQEVD